VAEHADSVCFRCKVRLKNHSGADPLLRVVNVEHLISEDSTHGIDPSGRITHRILLYTESVPDTLETRCKSPGKSGRLDLCPISSTWPIKIWKSEHCCEPPVAMANERARVILFRLGAN
jgi:hypothetical protein